MHVIAHTRYDPPWSQPGHKLLHLREAAVLRVWDLTSTQVCVTSPSLLVADAEHRCKEAPDVPEDDYST